MANCANLYLSHLSSCTFHMLHFSNNFSANVDKDLPDSILRANQQRGQTWVIYNAAAKHAMLKPVEIPTLGNASLATTLRESRICNVYLFIGAKPDESTMTKSLIIEYARDLAVTSSVSTFFIVINPHSSSTEKEMWAGIP